MAELHDAKHRIKRAYDMRSAYPDIAKREYDIAVQELQHADKDHASAAELIASYKKDHGEPPAVMLDLWRERHDKYIDKYARIKTMIDMYAR